MTRIAEVYAQVDGDVRMVVETPTGTVLVDWDYETGELTGRAALGERPSSTDTQGAMRAVRRAGYRRRERAVRPKASEVRPLVNGQG